MLMIEGIPYKYSKKTKTYNPTIKQQLTTKNLLDKTPISREKLIRLKHYVKQIDLILGKGFDRKIDFSISSKFEVYWGNKSFIHPLFGKETLHKELENFWIELSFYLMTFNFCLLWFTKNIQKWKEKYLKGETLELPFGIVDIGIPSFYTFTSVNKLKPKIGFEFTNADFQKGKKFFLWQSPTLSISYPGNIDSPIYTLYFKWINIIDAKRNRAVADYKASHPVNFIEVEQEKQENLEDLTDDKLFGEDDEDYSGKGDKDDYKPRLYSTSLQKTANMLTSFVNLQNRFPGATSQMFGNLTKSKTSGIIAEDIKIDYLEEENYLLECRDYIPPNAEVQLRELIPGYSVKSQQQPKTIVDIEKEEANLEESSAIYCGLSLNYLKLQRSGSKVSKNDDVQNVLEKLIEKVRKQILDVSQDIYELTFKEIDQQEITRLYKRINDLKKAEAKEEAKKKETEESESSISHKSKKRKIEPNKEQESKEKYDLEELGDLENEEEKQFNEILKSDEFSALLDDIRLSPSRFLVLFDIPSFLIASNEPVNEKIDNLKKLGVVDKVFIEKIIKQMFIN